MPSLCQETAGCKTKYFMGTFVTLRVPALTIIPDLSPARSSSVHSSKCCSFAKEELKNLMMTDRLFWVSFFQRFFHFMVICFLLFYVVLVELPGSPLSRSLQWKWSGAREWREMMMCSTFLRPTRPKGVQLFHQSAILHLLRGKGSFTTLTMEISQRKE